jgi:trehalose 6-phosphate synthase
VAVPQIVRVLAERRPEGGFVHAGGQRIYVYGSPISSGEETVGVLTLFHNASFIDVRLEEIWKHNLIRFLVLSLLVVAITLVVVRWSITGPIAQLAGWMRDLRTGKTKETKPAAFPKVDAALDPLISEATRMAKTLAVARKKAEEASRLALRPESLWTADRLKAHMRAELGGKKLYLVSNREPYMHEKDGPNVRCIVPAGGLVTALDPVMRACDGLWIAHGSGDADRETADGNSRLRVPPGEPAYTLRRVWLTKEEEDGYYYGFANEGLWPLCHITHTRPSFRLEDWNHYRNVNEKFADALLAEIAGEEAPLVLVQDYHLALLPQMIKERRPDAKVAIFWHIPWPNPEVFAICPYQQEILTGILGCDLIGFHLQFHCNNLLDTANRLIECRVDTERFSVIRAQKETAVRAFPISVDSYFRQPRPGGEADPAEKVRSELGLGGKIVALGVDRVDYTKGIIERILAVDRFLEKYPEYRKRFVFIQIGAPSRTHIKRYHEFAAEVDDLIQRKNWKYSEEGWRPIVYLNRHFSPEEIRPYYEIADICIVSSLHDGMNLVAKEYVAAKGGSGGMLVLSRFAGASRELEDAVLVNPYSIEEFADAIKHAIELQPEEKRRRMAAMDKEVLENNVYRWAASIITELTTLRKSAV